MLRKVNLDGELDEPIIIAETSASRASGFSQMTFTDKELIMAWTDVQMRTLKLKWRAFLYHQIGEHYYLSFVINLESKKWVKQESTC